MARDIEGLESRLELLTSFDSVVLTFTTPLEIDEEHIQKNLVSLLTSDAALKLVARVVGELLAAQSGPWGGNEVQDFLAGLAAADSYPPVRWSSWGGEPSVVLRRVQDVAGHQIGEDAWYTAVVDWILVGLAEVPSSSGTPLALHAVSTPRLIACQWRTKLLFSNRSGERPTLLQYWPPETLDASEQDEWQPLIRNVAPQITTPQLSDMTDSPMGRALLALSLIWELSRQQPGTPRTGEPE